MGAMKKRGGGAEKQMQLILKPEMFKKKKGKGFLLTEGLELTLAKKKKKKERSSALNCCFWESICYYLELNFAILNLVFIAKNYKIKILVLFSPGNCCCVVHCPGL